MYENNIVERILRMKPLLNERLWRQFLANEAMSCGHGGITLVSKISRTSRTTITTGINELKNNQPPPKNIRKNGGGRKNTKTKHPNITQKIREIIDQQTYGDPERILSYTTHSLRKIAEKLFETHNIAISYVTVGDILDSMGYSKQTNQKMLQNGQPHPDRNQQFEYINTTANKYLKAGEPVISVDTKKKELIGNFKNSGREYRPRGNPRCVLDHDFMIRELGKIAPYGVYNVNKNFGFVNVGVSHDTSEFAVESISRWWETVGKRTFLDAKCLYVTADCGGGSNGYRVKMWKYQLQQFASRVGLVVHVSHYPPGTSKWNKVEHRLFCYISKTWQGKPLVDVQTAVDLIGSTKTRTGLEVVCVRDEAEYELARTVSDEVFKTISLVKIEPFENWNYKILPQ